MFEEEVGRMNTEIPRLLLGESAFGRRGSNSSRASSTDRSPRNANKRRSSFDLLRESFQVGANTWSNMHEFLKLLWIVNIHQKAKACSCCFYRVTMQKVAQILSPNRGKN